MFSCIKHSLNQQPWENYVLSVTNNFSTDVQKEDTFFGVAICPKYTQKSLYSSVSDTTKRTPNVSQLLSPAHTIFFTFFHVLIHTQQHLDLKSKSTAYPHPRTWYWGSPRSYTDLGDIVSWADNCDIFDCFLLSFDRRCLIFASTLAVNPIFVFSRAFVRSRVHILLSSTSLL